MKEDDDDDDGDVLSSILATHFSSNSDGSPSCSAMTSLDMRLLRDPRPPPSPLLPGLPLVVDLQRALSAHEPHLGPQLRHRLPQCHA